MKALFIWREDSKNYIAELSKNINDKSIVWNEEDFKKINSNNFKSIFILVELNWVNTLFYGYDIASSIIKNWKDDENPPNIIFFSFIEQLNLYDIAKDVNKFFVKSFQHYQLPFFGSFKEEIYSSSKWKYLKKYALTEFGILNRISHSITSLLNKKETEITTATQEIIMRLNEIQSIIGTGIVNFLATESISDKAKLLKLNSLIVERINEISLNCSTSSFDKVTKNKKRLLLLEDNQYYTEKIKSVLEPHFDVIPFDNGKEALDELKNYYLNYSVVLADLELLENNQKIDQKVQGVEIIDFVREETPHIAWRVLTGLPRKGVKELIDVEINNILHKNQLDYYGYNEGMEEFIAHLKIQAERNVLFIKLRGPKTSFWSEKTKQGNEGGRFKRFYYNLLNSYPTIFDQMWLEIYTDLQKLIDDPYKVKIPSQLITPKDANGWLDNPNRTLDEKVSQLKKILTHRLIFFYFFKPNELVYYKGNEEKCLSNFPFWADGLQANPKAYTPVLGFETSNVEPTKFIFKGYGPLFEKEIEFLKNHENEFEDFFNENEEFCEVMDFVHSTILMDQATQNTNFKEKYEELKDNVFEIDFNYSVRILKSMALEKKKFSPNSSWNNVLNLLKEFKYGKDLEDEQPAYSKLNPDIKVLIDNFIDK